MHLPLKGKGELQLQRLLRAFIQGDFRGKHIFIDIRYHMDSFQAVFTDCFQINRLPDAGNRGVPAPHQPPVPILLTAGLGTVRLILHPQAQVIFSVGQQRSDIQGEGSVSPLMGTSHLSVDIYGALIIHRAEAEQHPFPLHFAGDREAAPVPDDGVYLIRGAQAAQLGLVGKGHHNFQRESKTWFHPPGC